MNKLDVFQALVDKRGWQLTQTGKTSIAAWDTTEKKMRLFLNFEHLEQHLKNRCVFEKTGSVNGLTVEQADRIWFKFNICKRENRNERR